MAVSLSQIVMSYPGTLALDQVSAEFRFDEVHKPDFGHDHH
jgi:ribose transport system ATP-binding protein